MAKMKKVKEKKIYRCDHCEFGRCRRYTGKLLHVHQNQRNNVWSICPCGHLSQDHNIQVRG